MSCDYCNGNGFFYSEKDLGPCVCSQVKPPETADEFFALPIRGRIHVEYEDGKGKPRVLEARAFVVTPGTMLLGHDAEGHVFILGRDELGFCRRPWA